MERARTDLVHRRIYIHLYSTSTYQNVTSGGLETGRPLTQNTQLSFKHRHDSRWAVVWRPVPLHRAVSLWKLARTLHSWIVLNSVERFSDELAVCNH